MALAQLGYEVVGVDFAAGMLRRARAKARVLRGVKVSFRSADFDQTLPFPAEDFDGALCVATLQCAQDAASFLREVRRVLRPGGHFLLVALDSSQRSSAKRQLKPGLARRVLRWVKALESHSRSVRRYGRGQLTALLGQAGLELVAERSWDGSLGFFCCAPSEGLGILRQGGDDMACSQERGADRRHWAAESRTDRQVCFPGQWECDSDV